MRRGRRTYRRVALGRAELALDRGRTRWGRQSEGRQPAEPVAEVGIVTGIGLQDGVPRAPCLLSPGAVDHLLVSVVGEQPADGPPDRVPEDDLAHPFTASELEPMGVAEERLVLAHRMTLVVEDRPARPGQRGSLEGPPG